MKTEIEYLGLPYTNEDGEVENWRADISDRIAADLFRKEGRIIYAPISHWHHIAVKYKLPGGFEYWEKLDEEFLKISKKFLIISLPGWENSNGLNNELKIAEKYNIKREYIDPKPYLTKEEKEKYYGEEKEKELYISSRKYK